MSYACLEERKRIPNRKMGRAEHKHQGAKYKDQDGDGASCAKRA